MSKDNKKKKDEIPAQKEQATGASGQAPAAESEVQPAAEEIKVDVPKLLELLKQAQKERDDYLATAQRVQADFDNYRRRNAQVRADACDEATAEALTALLPVLDNLTRALDASNKAGESGPLKDGIEMVLRQMRETLDKLGLKDVEAEPGTVFDPTLHNAVMTVPPEENDKEGTICDVFQPGYKFKDKVIRYAMVRVFKA